MITLYNYAPVNATNTIKNYFIFGVYTLMKYNFFLPCRSIPFVHIGIENLLLHNLVNLKWFKELKADIEQNTI